jgi:hypothetical protein
MFYLYFTPFAGWRQPEITGWGLKIGIADSGLSWRRVGNGTRPEKADWQFLADAVVAMAGFLCLNRKREQMARNPRVISRSTKPTDLNGKEESNDRRFECSGEYHLVDCARVCSC